MSAPVSPAPVTPPPGGGLFGSLGSLFSKKNAPAPAPAPPAAPAATGGRRRRHSRRHRKTRRKHVKKSRSRR